MDKTILYAKTGKGLLEVKNKSRALSKDLFRLLSLVDGRSSVVDLHAKLAPISERDLTVQLRQLSDLGFVKEMAAPASQTPASATGMTVSDDLDFTSMLGGESTRGFYSNSELEKKSRDEAERRDAESRATKVRQEAERKSQDDARLRVHEEAQRRALLEAQAKMRTEAERKAREQSDAMIRKEAEMRARLAEETAARIEAERLAREEAERKAREESEKRARLEQQAQKQLLEERRRMEAERKQLAAAAQALREETERKAREEATLRAQADLQRKVEEEARRVREEAERKAQEEVQRRLEEETRRLRQEAEQRVQEETRRRVEEESRRVREEAERDAREAARRQLEAETLRLREEAELRAKEEATRRAEQEARRAREEAERIAREESERRQREEAMQRRQEDEARQRRELEERLRREIEERERREAELKRLHEEELRRQAEEARRREEEERVRREQEEQRLREEERLRREAEEARRLEEARVAEEARQRAAEEAERQRAEEERQRREAEALAERAREEARLAEEARQRAAGEAERQRAEEERLRAEQERQRREAEERELRAAEEARKAEALRLREEQERREAEEAQRQRDAEERLLREREEARKLEEARGLEEDERRHEEDERRRQEDERRRLEDDRRRAEEERAMRAQDTRPAPPGAIAPDLVSALSEREPASVAEAPDDARKRAELEALLYAELGLSPGASSPPAPDSTHASGDVPVLGMADLVEPATADGDTGLLAPIDLPSLSLDSPPEEAPLIALESRFDAIADEFSATQRQRQALEDEARKAMERAEEEAKERELAEHIAREEAELRLRADQEQRRREEAVVRARQDAERRQKEKEERRQKEEEAKRRADMIRHDAERNIREQALAKQRADQEEKDRQKSARTVLQKAGQRSIIDRAKPVVIGIVAVLVILIGLLHVVPVSFYAPAVAQIASKRIGEPVVVGSLRVAVFPSPVLRLEDVRFGTQFDIRAASISVEPDLLALLSSELRVKRLVVESLTAPADALPRIAGWARAGGSQPEVDVRRVTFKGMRLALTDVTVPNLDAEVLMSADGTFRGGDLRLSDGTLSAEFTQNDDKVVVAVRGRGWKPTYGPALVVDEVMAKGTVTANSATLDSIEAQLYGGSAKGTATIEWGTAWKLRGDLVLQRIQLYSFMEAVTRDARAAGELEGRMKFDMGAPDFSRLYATPQVQATFKVTQGTLDGVDMVRALQTPKAEPVFGGKTRFDDLSGSLFVAGGRYQYRDLRMKSGVLLATGSFDIDAAQDVGGRILVQLEGPVTPIRSSYGVSGKLKSIALKP